MRGGVAAILVVSLMAAGCGPARDTVPIEPYLLVWAGDADRKDSDFLAVVDADPESRGYGKVLTTIPVKSRGNEPHLLNATQRDDRRVFATGVATNRTFVFDLREPRDGKLTRVDQAGGQRVLGAPIEPVSLPGGRVAVTCADRIGYRGTPRELFDAPGGLVELEADGRFRREVRPERDPTQTLIVAPAGGAVVPGAGMLVTANHGHGYVGTARGEFMPGISVGVWRADKLTPKATVLLPAGPRGEENLGPYMPRALHRGGVVTVNTHEGGALYVSDSIGQDRPTFALAFDFGAGSRPSGAAITPDDRYYVTALAGRNKLVALDLRDAWHPRPASVLRFDVDPLEPAKPRKGGPSAVAMSADGQRVAVADYTVDAPGERLDGDRRVHLVRLDTTTGRLRFDDAFRDEVTNEVGIDFNRTKWPHGETGPARPHGVLFATAAPPDD